MQCFHSPYCNKDYTKKDYVLKHIETCRSLIPVKCSKCNQLFKNQAKLEAHMKKHVETECKFCEKTFGSKQTMMEHQSHVHTSQVEKYCRFCKTVFYAKVNLIKHMKNIHKSDDLHKGYCQMENGQSILIVTEKITEIPVYS